MAFALSDLIDNALRATKNNAANGRPRRIAVSLLEGPNGMSICVSDNGEGMSKRTLNSWRARAASSPTALPKHSRPPRSRLPLHSSFPRHDAAP